MPDWTTIGMFVKAMRGAVYLIVSPIVATIVCAIAGFPMWSFLFHHPLYFLTASAFQIIAAHTVAQGGYLPASFNPNLKGKNAIVTGASNGIGVREAASLAKWGANVVIAVRNVAAGEAVARQIIAEFNITDPNQVTVLPLDVSSQASVREFVRLWKQKGNKKLDILLNNAGIMGVPFGKSVDGVEMHMATNHLGHFLLAELLMDELKASGAAKVVNVGAALHIRAGETPLPLEYLAAPPSDEGYNRDLGYAWSKTANQLHAKELNARLQPYGGAAFSVHPGVINTNLIAASRGQRAAMIGNWTFGWVCLKTPQHGADAVLYCALHPGAVPGGYHQDCHPEQAYTKMSMDDAQAKRLWAWSERVCGLKK